MEYIKDILGMGSEDFKEIKTTMFEIFKANGDFVAQSKALRI